MGDAKKDLETIFKKYLEEKKLDQDEEYMFFGYHHTVKVGMIPKKREITDLNLVRKFLGADAFMKLATVPMKHIDSYLSKEQQEACIEKKRTGSRTMKYEEVEPESTLKTLKK